MLSHLLPQHGAVMSQHGAADWAALRGVFLNATLRGHLLMQTKMSLMEITFSVFS